MFGLGVEGSMDSIATTLHSTVGSAGNFGINFGTAAKFIFETLSAKHPEHFIVSTKYENSIYDFQTDRTGDIAGHKDLS